MKKGLKIGLILGGTGIAIASTIFIIKKVKGKSISDSGSSSGGGSSNSGDSFSISAIEQRGNYAVLGINGDTRKETDKSKYVGKRAYVEGTNTALDYNDYYISDVWIDSNGKIGALYLSDTPTVTKASGLNATATII